MPALVGYATSNEVHNLQTITLDKVGLGPLLPGDNIEVQFYGHAVLLHAQLFDQQGQSNWGEAALLAVNYEFHLYIDSRNYPGKEQALARWVQ